MKKKIKKHKKYNKKMKKKGTRDSPRPRRQFWVVLREITICTIFIEYRQSLLTITFEMHHS